MKITCGSCGAKYTVSDEKVHGKTVKVKCRKCSAVIVVSSTGEVQTTGGNAVGGAAAGSDMAYTVSVSDTDQRNMTMAEIVSAYNEGIIDAETFVWAEGMDDWQPLKDVDTIVDALHEAAEGEPDEVGADLNSTVAMDQSAGPYSQPPAAYSQPPAAYSQPPAGYSQPPAQQPAAGYGDYGAQQSSGGGYGSQPAAAAASSSADMFGTPAAMSSSPFDVSGGSSGGSSAQSDGGGFFATSSSSSFGGGGTSPSTGTEENSAIFSLNMLTAKVEGDAPSTSSSSGTTEDSGLIDLKALAAGMGGDSEGMAAAAAAPAADGVFPLGAPAPIASPMVSASIPAPAQGTNRGLIVGLGLAVAVLAAALIFFIVKDSGETAANTANTASTSDKPVNTGDAAPPPAPEPVAGTQPSSDPSSSASTDASAAPETSGKVAVGPRPAGPARPTPGGPTPTPTPQTGPKPPPPPPAGGVKGPCGCAQSDLMCHMRCSNKKKKK